MTKARTQYIDIVFDKPPQHEPSIFQEVEDDRQHSINCGAWTLRPDGSWALRITPAIAAEWLQAPAAQTPQAAADEPVAPDEDGLDGLVRWTIGSYLLKQLIALVGGQSSPRTLQLFAQLADSIRVDVDQQEGAQSNDA